jgi:hypothetical protein
MLLAAEGAPAGGSHWSGLFVSSDREIEVRIDSPALPEGVLTEWVWQAPDGTVFRREWRLATGAGDRVRLPVVGTAAAARLGRWQVQVREARGKLLASAEFQLAADRDEWLATNSEDLHARLQALSSLCGCGRYPFLARRFASALPEPERRAIVDCFIDERAAFAPLAEELQRTPQDESILLLAYRVKLDRVEKAMGAITGRAELLGEVRQLLTPWDGIVLQRLLAHADPGLRADGARLLGEVDSVEAVLLLEQALNDPEASVRIAAAAALERHAGPAAEESIQRQLAAEQLSEVRKRLRKALDSMNGRRQ